MASKKKQTKSRSKSLPTPDGAPSTNGSRVKETVNEPIIEKRINKRFVLIALGIFLAVGVGMHVVHAVQVERNAVHLKDRAEAAEAEGEYFKAAQLFAQYLSFREDDHDTQLHLVRLRDGLATHEPALHNALLGYEQVLRRDPQRPDEVEIRQDLIAVAIEIKLYSQALHHLEVLLTQERFQEFREDTAQVAELHYQMGQCHYGEGRIQEAFQAFLLALESNDSEHKFYLPLAELFAEQHESLPPGKEKDISPAEFEDLPVAERIRVLLSTEDQRVLLTEVKSEKADQDAREQFLKNQRNALAKAAADRILDWMVQVPEKGEAYRARAGYRYLRRELDEARQDVEKAQALLPNDPAILLLSGQLAVDQAHQARIMRKRTSYSDFVNIALRAAKAGQADPEYPASFYLLESQIAEETRKGIYLLPARAEKPGDSFQYPAGMDHPLLQAQWQLFQSAEETLRQGLETVQKSFDELNKKQPDRTRLRKENPRPELTRYQLTLLANQMRWSLADTLLSQHTLLSGSQSEKSIARERLDEVRKHITALERSSASRGLVEFLKGRLLICDEKWRDAAWILELTRNQLAVQSELRNRINLLLVQCYGQMGNPDQQLQVALAAKEKNPEWLIRLPEIYERTNRPKDAIAAYEKIKDIPGNSLNLARLRFKEELGKPMESRRWDEIYKLLEAEDISKLKDAADLTILHSNVTALEAAQLREQGETAKAFEKYQTALGLLDEAVRKSPKNAKLWVASARMEFGLPYPEGRTIPERIADAKAILKRGRDELGDAVELRVMEAGLAAFLPPAEAVRELAALEKLEYPTEEKVQLLEGLARAHAQLAENATDSKEKEAAMARVLELRQQVAERQPTNIEPQIELGELAYAQNNEGVLKGAIARVENVEGPTGPNGNYLKALRLGLGIKPAESLTEADDNKLVKARRLLKAARRDRPFWAVLPRTLGRIEEAIGNLEGAVTEYEKAYELGDRSRQMITTMVTYYTEQQRFEHADEFLRKLADDSPLLLTEDLARQRWRAAWRMRRQSEAVGLATNVASRSTDFRDHLWEAKLRYAEGEHGPAVLQALEKARELAPEAPAPWLETVIYHVRMKDLKAAEAVIEQAKTSLAKEPPHLKPVTLARCYELINERENAERYYLAAVDSTESNSTERITHQIILADFYSRTPGTDPNQQAVDVKKATAVIDLLLDATRDVPQYARDWARRRKALIAAFSGRYDDTELALQLLAKGRGKQPSIEDLRVESRLLNVRNRYSDRLALIEVLETLKRKKAISNDEKLLLARTYENTNQWPKAQAEFRELLDDVGHESKAVRAALLVDYAIALLNRSGVDRQEMLSEGQALVRELERLEPKSFRAVTTRALLLHRQDKGAEAVPLLKDYLEGLKVITPEQAFRDLVQQEKVDEALMFLQNQLDDKTAQQIVEHVKKLIAEDNQKEALAVLNRYIQASDMVDGVQTSLVRGIARFLEQIEQHAAAEEVFREFVERSKRPQSALELAAFLARRNRIDEALDICEAAWESCDPPLVAKVSVGTLRSGKPTPAQIQRVEGPLSDALENATEENRMLLISSMADLRDLQGRHKESIGLYRQILQQNPRNAIALNNLAWLLSYQPAFHAEALKLIEQAISLYGPQGAILDTRAMIHLRRGETQLAQRDIKNALDELPVAALYFHQAQIQWALGKKTLAEQAFQESQSQNLDPVTDLHVLEATDYQKMEVMFK